MIKITKPQIEYLNYAYSKWLPEFMHDIMTAGDDFGVLAFAISDLCDAVLGLSSIPHAFAVVLASSSENSNMLETYHYSSNVASDEDLKAVLEMTKKHLMINPVFSTDTIRYCTLDDSGFTVDKIPESILIIPIRTTSANCGYALIFFRDNIDRYDTDSPPVMFLSKIMYLAALSLQCEFNNALLEHYLMSDQLTGLPNRDHIYESIIYMLQTAEAFGNRFALLVIRVNGLKNINNSLGIITGDLLLKAMGTLIETAVRASTKKDTVVGRLSGGDFIVMITLPNNNRMESDEAVIKSCCKAIISGTERYVEINGYKIYPSANIGASIYPLHGETAEELLRKADLAKNDAKLAGPGTYRTYKSFMDGDAEEILFLNNNLPTAITSNQFEMHYQAMVDVKSEKIVAAEALIRWNHPKRGLVRPDRFIPFAEKNSYGVQIDLQVLSLVCSQIREWEKKGVNLVVSVNISPRHFMNGLIYDSVSKALDSYGVNPSRLRIELLENILLDDFNAVIKVINDLHSLGVTVALDDFGAGYSSLAYVARLPLDYLKIDRTFMMNHERNPDNKIIMETILTLAKGMKVKTVAEGVESKESFEFLQSIGCDTAQGYYINKPVGAYEFEQLYKQWHYNKGKALISQH